MKILNIYFFCLLLNYLKLIFACAEYKFKIKMENVHEPTLQHAHKRSHTVRCVQVQDMCICILF